jgi:hypothetical protein
MSEESELQSEFGSNDGALFINATAVDSQGHEMPVPMCNKCNDGYMTYLIGRNHQVWMCSCGYIP